MIRKSEVNLQDGMFYITAPNITHIIAQEHFSPDFISKIPNNILG
jgi:hypothetical protein